MREALLSSLPKLVQSWFMDRRRQYVLGGGNGNLEIETPLDELGRSEGGGREPGTGLLR